MSALPSAAAALSAEGHDQFIVGFGKSGALGVFTSAEPLLLRRGQAVIVRTPRGVEVGTVLCQATLRQARLLGATSSGELLRTASVDDEAGHEERIAFERHIFEKSRTWAQSTGLAAEILDVDLMFDGAQAIVQFVGSDTDAEKLAHALEQHFTIAIRLENLAVAMPAETHEHGGCDKPDCGRRAGGSCTTCSSGGGGCSSCGAGKTDLREYFSHLRTKMEAAQRIPLT
jgi:cell fate regulator YaaT (PSP1 superfamily)